MILLPYHSLKNIIPPDWHGNDHQTIPLHLIPVPMQLPKSLSNPIEHERDIVSGTSYLLGLKNVSLYGTQGCKHILALTNLGKSDCIKGNCLRDAI